MRTAPAFLVLAMAAIALAGCLGSSEQPVVQTSAPAGTTGGPGAGNATVPGNQSPAANRTGPVVKTFNGHAAGVAVPGTFALEAPTVSDNNGDFPVANGSTGIVVEVAWNGSDALEVFLYPPCSDAGAAGTGLAANCPSPLRNEQGKSPARIMVTDLGKLKDSGAGTWTIAVFAQQNPTGVAFKAASSVFYGEVPKDSYTAVNG